MIETLATNAEKKAEQAEGLLAFSGLKLLHIKRQVAYLLGLIGRDGIFDEYTRHDISHIDEMLAILDWLIPETTRHIMSPADWLLVVLSIYFHDLGMLVTRAEYEERSSSGFPQFCTEVLFADKAGADYEDKVQRLPPDRRERFLYQEFVRKHHAERIRAWIKGDTTYRLGVAESVMSEIETLLKPLDAVFRRDLALVCESHHLPDLDRLDKYSVSQPYGNSDAETANLQYAAILLRTADLLHITRDRVPSIMYREINPTDPLSQIEWQKQMAVRRVRSKLGLNRERTPDENAPRDTIEVYATFTNPDAFHGLTAYLLYAAQQLRQSFGWVQQARTEKGAHYEFPWRYIDDTNIQTEGFLKEKFAFTLDEKKILELLTGQTLYNDSSVVTRELLQNALDAARLQVYLDKRSGIKPTLGKVKVHWDSRDRILTVEDNGTGMTQDIIERHLLKVGSSRYQDEQFIKQYPEFSSVSRFGIGILSTFMIADNVEIVTCHPDDVEARHLSLRSVHGSYLIRLLNKDADELAKRLSPHGTLLKLTVRKSAEMHDIIEDVKKWVMFPEAEVALTVNDGPEIKIGYTSPKEALAKILEDTEFSKLFAGIEKANTRIEEIELDGVTLAYALRWSEFFREWSFVESTETWIGSTKPPLIGTCIEGIRVLFNTPGFPMVSILAIANAKGPNVPKTNVVRTSFDISDSGPRAALFHKIYSIYTRQVLSEFEELHAKRGMSLTWATEEVEWLLRPLFRERSEDLFVESGGNDDLSPSEYDVRLLREACDAIPSVIVEEGNTRRAISASNLRESPCFWTTDSLARRSTETLVRELPSMISYSQLVRFLGNSAYALPNEATICGTRYQRPDNDPAFRGKEVDHIEVIPDQRRVDLRWVNRDSPARWAALPEELQSLMRMTLRSTMGSYYNDPIQVGTRGIETRGTGDWVGIRTLGSIFILPDTFLAKELAGRIEVMQRIKGHGYEELVVFSLALTFSALRRESPILDPEAWAGQFERQFSEFSNWQKYRKAIEAEFPIASFLDIVVACQGKLFDPSSWIRGGSFEYYY